MDSVSTPPDPWQGTHHHYDPLDLRRRLADGRRDGVRMQTVTLTLSIMEFGERGDGAMQDPGLFAPIVVEGRRYTPLLRFNLETEIDGGFLRSEYADHFPIVRRGWANYYIEAVTHPGGEVVLVGLFRLGPSLSGGAHGDVQYVEEVEPWIEALRQNAGEAWSESGSAGESADGGTGRQILDTQPKTQPPVRVLDIVPESVPSILQSDAAHVASDVQIHDKHSMDSVPRCDITCGPRCAFIQDFENAVRAWAARPGNRDKKPRHEDIATEVHLNEDWVREQVTRHYPARWIAIRSAIQAGDTHVFSAGFTYE